MTKSIILTKKRGLNVANIYLGVRNHLFDIKKGKNGAYQSSTTQHCGNADNAIGKFEEYRLRFLAEGFKEESKSNLADITLDKSDWHLNESYPKDIDNSKVFVYTGFFVCWLANNNLILKDSNFSKGLKLLKERVLFPSQFFSEYLDGNFLTSQLTDMAIPFTLNYYYAENGEYFNDYFETFCTEEMSLYHVEDTWDNYDRIAKVIDSRYKGFFLAPAQKE